MKLKPFIICLGVLLHIACPSFAQRNNVTVNPLTGTASVVIPLYEYKRGIVDMPVRLVYNATGIKPKSIEGTAGMGWQLDAGGAIVRQVRGLPDDVVKDNMYPTANDRKGWMYNTNAAKINSFGIANDNNPATCTDGTSDLNYLTTNFSDYSDTEPDIFYVNAPGLSCQLVYDQVNAQFRVLGSQDVKITYYTNSTSSLTVPGGINQFTITNNRGIKYSFGEAETITQKATDGTPVYFKNKYNQYKNGITFYNNWHLISMLDDSQSGVRLTYTAAHDQYSTDPVNLYMPGATSATLQYNIRQTVTPKILATIQANYSTDMAADVLSFNWNWLSTATYFNNEDGKYHQYGTGATVINGISGAGLQLSFSYDSPDDGDPVYGSQYKRYYLRNVYDSRCSSPINYNFRYAGELNYTTGSSSYQSTLPDSSTKKVDYWGYYSTANASTTSVMPKVWIASPSTTVPQYAIYQTGAGGSTYPFYTTTGNIRSADTANVRAGSLVKISYPEGGSTSLVYESNDYADGPSGLILPGNGIRTRKTIDDDGAGNTITTSYSYLNPSTGLSSGKPLSQPSFAFTVPYGGTATGNSLWNNCTVVSDNDLSDEDHSILYSYVKQSRTGAGSTQYQYYVPANYWNTSATPGCNNCTTADWAPTIINTQRVTCATATGPAANTIYGYPATPNANYDAERGLIQKITNYNDAGTKVSETSYQYQRSASTPQVITALKAEEDPFTNGTQGLKAFAKYAVNYGTEELTSQQSTTVYDSQNLTQPQTTSVNYFFDSPYHKLATRTQVTNSDNSVITTNIKYVKDYPGLSASSNLNIDAIYNLQLLNENIPVETYRQITRSGSTKTTSADITLFNRFTAGVSGFYKYRPVTKYNFVSADGLSSFTPSAITMPATFTKDPSYPAVASANFTEYDYNGSLQTGDDGHKRISSAILDNYNGQPAITIANAAASEIAFNDFDSDMYTLWVYAKTGSSSYVVPASSHTGLAMGLGTGQSFTFSNIKRNIKASNYIISAWINTSAAGNITFSFTNATSGSSTPAAQVLSNTGGVWKYQEWKLPLGTISGTFTLNISASVNAGFDDIIFYPENAEATTFSYDPVTHFKTSVTNTNGVSAYFTDDNWGRPVYTFDQDRNLVKKMSYLTQAQNQSWNPAIVAPGDVHANTPAIFSVNGYDNCVSAGTLVTWDFGDGTAPVTTALSSSPAHTYTGTGTKTVTATAVSPVFGTKVMPPVSINVGVPLVTLTYNNYTTYNDAKVQLTFYNNTTGQTFTLYGSQFASGGQTITQGSYTINATVTPDGQAYDAGTGIGWSSMLLSNSTGVFTCGDRNTYNAASCTNVNLSNATTLQIDINRVTCAVAMQ